MTSPPILRLKSIDTNGGAYKTLWFEPAALIAMDRCVKNGSYKNERDFLNHIIREEYRRIK